MHIGYHAKDSLFLSCLMKIELSRLVFESNKISVFTKIFPVGAEFFHADRRTDVTKVIVSYRSFVNIVEKERNPRCCHTRVARL